MKITRATKIACDFACKHFHYAKCTPVIRTAYSVWSDSGEWCGVIIYGPGATPNIGKPYDKWQGQILELERVALNGKQGHGKTSEALGMTIRAIKKEVPCVDLIVSYADLDQDHIGILYQSTNWIYTGISNKGARGAFIIFGKKMHSKSVHSKGWKQSIIWLKENVDPNAEEFITRGKHRYIYPLNKRLRKRYMMIGKDYPKRGEDSGQAKQENRQRAI